MTAAAFVDRDGVINVLVPDRATGLPESPLDPRDVALLPGATHALRALRAAGLLLVVVSNQPAAAKGAVPSSALDRVHDRVVELLAAEGVAIDDWRYCRHRRQDNCRCRKPQPGLLLDAASVHGIDLARSWMIGDTDADVGAGQAVGARTILLEHRDSAHRRTGAERPDVVMPDLAAAAQFVLHASGRDSLPRR